MKLPPPSGFESPEGVAAYVRRLVKALQVWGVDHDDSGGHVFPWHKPVVLTAQFTNWTPTTIALFKYELVGATMRLAFDVTGTVATTPSTLAVPIPNGYKTKEMCAAGMYAYNDAGTAGVGVAVPVGDQVTFYKNILGTAWTAGTARVQGTIAFEVQ